MANRTVDVRERSIGPAHDPYGATTVTVKCNGRKAEFYSDGLGRRHLWLGDLNDGANVRDEEWFDKGGFREQVQHTKANLLFKRHVGVTVDEAKAQHDELMRGDPFCGQDPYYGGP